MTLNVFLCACFYLLVGTPASQQWLKMYQKSTHMKGCVCALVWVCVLKYHFATVPWSWCVYDHTSVLLVPHRALPIMLPPLRRLTQHVAQVQITSGRTSAHKERRQERQTEDETEIGSVAHTIMHEFTAVLYLWYHFKINLISLL